MPRRKIIQKRKPYYFWEPRYRVLVLAGESSGRSYEFYTLRGARRWIKSGEWTDIEE